MSLLEAMYLGRVCIVSNIIGNKDVITEGVNGYLAEDVSGFCSQLQKILDADAAVLDRIRQKAKEDVQKEYNTTVMANKYAALYKNAVTKKQSPLVGISQRGKHVC